MYSSRIRLVDPPEETAIQWDFELSDCNLSGTRPEDIKFDTDSKSWNCPDLTAHRHNPRGLFYMDLTKETPISGLKRTTFLNPVLNPSKQLNAPR